MSPRTKTKTAPVDATALRQAILDTETELNTVLLEREEPIRLILLGLLSGQNTYLLGVPGTGKSLMVNSLTDRIAGSNVFTLLMTRFTEPGEVFGPLSLTKLQQDVYERCVDGKLPTAHVAFLDEVFKANSAILNALLTILNEGRYDNGAQAIQVPLMTCIGASNELPQGDDLAALYDRFLLRYVVRPLGEEQNVAKLLRMRPSVPSAILSLQDIEAARKAVSAVTLPDAVIETILKLRQALGSDGVRPSDRRLRQAVSVLQAQAWLEGRDEIEDEDLLVLQHVFWNEPEEQRKVASKVICVAVPALKGLFEMLDVAATQLTVVQDTRQTADARLEASAKLRKLHDKAKREAKGAGKQGAAVLAKLDTYKAIAVRAAMDLAGL